MTEEIKEILDRLDFNEWEVDLYKVPITWCELYNIRDYITNLQQLYENALKVNQNENKYRTELESKYVLLQQENERLKEQNKEWKDNHKAVCIQRDNILDNILDNIVKDTEERIDYKSRCKKASNKLDSMFANGEENKILDDLLELDKIVKGDK